mmetsp:Transcript_14522/g.45646  ORF Transcript_14522/g.45646 Transcript_14522/m.45646 type:complete len:111 (+) Transcript_14522:371-703(+)
MVRDPSGVRGVESDRVDESPDGVTRSDDGDDRSEDDDEADTGMDRADDDSSSLSRRWRSDDADMVESSASSSDPLPDTAWLLLDERSFTEAAAAGDDVVRFARRGLVRPR